MFHANAVSGDSGNALEMAGALTSPPSLDKVFQNKTVKAAPQGLPQRNHVAQHGSFLEGPLSNEELDYDDTDVQPGDQIQQFQGGRSVQVMTVP